MSDINKCAEDGNLAGLQRLVAAGVSVDARGSANWTPIIHASRYNRLSVVEYLIASKASVNAQNDDGDSSLHRATANGHLAIVDLLLNAGADASLKNHDRETALDYAVGYGQSECAQAIRQHKERGDDLGPKAAHFTGAE